MTPNIMLDIVAPYLTAGLSQQAFRVLCRTVDNQVGGVDETEMGGLLNAISDWPDAVRLVSVPWKDIFDVLNRPSWRLVRTLEVSIPEAPTIDEVVQLAERGELGALSGLCLQGVADFYHGLEGGELTDNDLRTILTSKHLRNLTRLRLQVTPTDAIYTCIADLAKSGELKNIVCLELLLVGADAPLALEGHCPRIQELALYAIDKALLPAEVTKGLVCEDANASPELTSALATSNSLCSRLRLLDLAGNDLAGSKIESLVQPGLFPSLRELNLRQCGISGRELALLCESDFMCHLQCLALQQNQFRDNDWELLARVPFEGIRLLDLSETLPKGSLWNEGGGDQGISAIAQSGFLIDITELKIVGNNIGDAGMASLAHALFSKRIETLLLGSNPFSDEGVIAFCEQGQWQQLRRLDVGTRGITDRAIRAVTSCERLASLRGLLLNTASISSTGILALCHSRCLAQLRELRLAHCDIDDDLVSLLATGASWEQLQHLSLNNNRIGKRGVVVLSNSSVASRISTLDLSSNPIGNDGGLAIAHSDYFGWLETLNIRGCSIDEEIVDAIKSSPRLPLLLNVLY